MEDLKKFFVKSELIPAIIQDYKTKEVLMLAYMNEESLAKTLQTGYTWFYSRSRKELWNKGATSGHVQKVIKMDYDCDEDTLLVYVEQTGAACHTGNRSCFYRTLAENGEVPEANPLVSLEQVIADRKENPEEGSYTCYLFEKGVDKISKKIGEEATETVIAAKNGDNDELMNEINDLLYHVMVLCANQGLDWKDVERVLDERNEKIGNLKQFHTVDKNT